MMLQPVILTYPIDGIFQNVSLFTNDFVFKVFGVNAIWNFRVKKLCFWYWQHNQFISKPLVELICIQFMRNWCIFVSIHCNGIWKLILVRSKDLLRTLYIVQFDDPRLDWRTFSNSDVTLMRLQMPSKTSSLLDHESVWKPSNSKYPNSQADCLLLLLHWAHQNPYD